MILIAVVLILWSLGGTLGMLALCADLYRRGIDTDVYLKNVSKTKNLLIAFLAGPLMWIVMFIGYFADGTTKSKEV